MNEALHFSRVARGGGVGGFVIRSFYTTQKDKSLASAVHAGFKAKYDAISPLRGSIVVTYMNRECTRRFKRTLNRRELTARGPRGPQPTREGQTPLLRGEPALLTSLQTKHVADRA